VGTRRRSRHPPRWRRGRSCHGQVGDVAAHGTDGRCAGSLEFGHRSLTLLGHLGLSRRHLLATLVLCGRTGLLQHGRCRGAGLGDGGVVVTAHLLGCDLGFLGRLEICDLLGASLLADLQQRWQQPVPHQDPQREERHRTPEDLPDGVGDDGVDVGGIPLGREGEK